jgi:predicted glycosyl hydrolase (DUF1957 family)
MHVPKNMRDGFYRVKIHNCDGGTWGDRWYVIEWQNAYRQWCWPHNGPAIFYDCLVELGERVSLPRVRLKKAA